MKLRLSKRRTQALTFMDVLVIIAVLALFFACIDFGAPASTIAKAKKISCVNNLKQIMLAHKVWAGDHFDKYPMDVSATNGGVMEWVNGPDAWKFFQVMSNQLYTPKVLYCPAASSQVATDFGPAFSRTNISYFINLDATDTDPQSLVIGDDNFEIGGLPVKPGVLILSSNTPLAWSAVRHNHSGNIALADGSVQGANNSGLTNLLRQTGFATNRLVIP